MQGRPPKPLEQHQLDGTYRADRHGAPGEVVQVDGAPQMPEGFDGERRACWESVVSPLVALKVARAIDQPQLVALCEWWSRYRKISDKLDAVADLDVMSMGRLIRQAAESWKQFSQIAARFGLTPADRMRLRVANESEQKKKGVLTRQRG